MERMKVLFITMWYPTKEQPAGGVFVREHAKAVRLYDNVIVLHCVGPKHDMRKLWQMEQETNESLTEGIQTYRVWYRFVPIPKLYYFAYLWSVLRAFRRIISQGFKPDIIHAHVYDAGVPSVLIGKFYGIPVVVTEHTSAFPRKLIGGMAPWTGRFAFVNADVVMPVSMSLQKAIRGYGINARFEVVPNVADTKIFFPRLSSKGRHKLKRILFVGLLVPIKGVPYLLRALSDLSERQDNWHLDIVGDGPKRAEYERMALGLGLAHKVTFHGMKSKKEVAESMRQADLFVLPSLWENLPCVLIEAMACGLPIVSTLTGGIPEMIDEGTGILIPPGDAAKLSKAIAQMMESLNEFDRQAIAQKALQYSSESIGRLIHSIYRDCIRK